MVPRGQCLGHIQYTLIFFDDEMAAVVNDRIEIGLMQPKLIQVNITQGFDLGIKTGK